MIMKSILSVMINDHYENSVLMIQFAGEYLTPHIEILSNQHSDNNIMGLYRSDSVAQ